MGGGRRGRYRAFYPLFSHWQHQCRSQPVFAFAALKAVLAASCLCLPCREEKDGRLKHCRQCSILIWHVCKFFRKQLLFSPLAADFAFAALICLLLHSTRGESYPSPLTEELLISITSEGEVSLSASFPAMRGTKKGFAYLLPLSLLDVYKANLFAFKALLSGSLLLVLRAGF